jgi:cobalamin synthase
MNDLRTALELSTVLPIRCGDKISARAFAYHPLVGLFIGLTLTTAGFFLPLALTSLLAEKSIRAGFACEKKVHRMT